MRDILELSSCGIEIQVQVLCIYGTRLGPQHACRWPGNIMC